MEEAMDINIGADGKIGPGVLPEKSLISEKVEAKGDKRGGGPGYAPKSRHTSAIVPPLESEEPDQDKKHLLDIII